MSLLTLHKSRGGKFKRNDKKDVAAIFEAHVRVVRRIWEMAEKQKALGQEVDVSNKRKGNCGRKPMDDILSLIPTIPLNRRSTVRSLARALGISPTTLYKKFKVGKIRRHSSTLKPALTEKNMKDRVDFCISMLDHTTLGDEAGPSFGNMQNIIHIDEKWFYMTKKRRHYYLLPEEPDPERTVQNKNSIGKVMFLTAVTRPRYDANGKVIFSGKVGVWPFVKVTPAAKKSKNREKGTLETKNIIVNREVMREYIIQKVVPAIQAVWPDNDGQTIWIQQDNARTHIPPDDAEFAEAVVETGLDIRIMHQPANSPDMNALDLGFFSGIQSLTDCRAPKTLKELIEGVQEEFDAYDVANLNKVFITLQTCMVEVMDSGGGNGYKIPHLNKNKLKKLKKLPSKITVPPAIYAKALEMLGLGVR
jgi:hypothetical protein